MDATVITTTTERIELCITTDHVWNAVAWQVTGFAAWLLFLVLADTKEREKIGEASHKPLSVSFALRSGLWLLVLWLASMGAWNIWRFHCWIGAHDQLVPYVALLLFTFASWRQFWVAHDFFTASVFSGFALILAATTMFSFASKSPGSMLLMLPYTLLLLFDTVYCWLFYKTNRGKEVGSRDLGRFQEHRERANANTWVLTQNPQLHIIPSNFNLQDRPRTLADVNRRPARLLVD